MSMRSFASAALTVFLFASSAAAQEGEGQMSAAETEARSLFQAGEAAFGDARYEDALRYFREAHRLSGRAGLLYNIGVAADRLRRDQEALEAFERFVAEAPPGMRQRADAEARIPVLREAIARGTAAPPAEESSGTSPAPSSGGDATAAWIVLGVGAAAAIAGGVLLGLGQADADSVTNAPDGTPYADVQEAAERADLFRNMGWVLLGVGVAAAAAGLTWAIVVGSESSAPSAHLDVLPGGLRVRGSF